MEFECPDIKCNTFLSTYAVIKRADAKIKKPASTRERGYYVQDIIGEIKFLLSCSSYTPVNPSCLNCYSFSYRYIRECSAQVPRTRVNGERSRYLLRDKINAKET